VPQPSQGTQGAYNDKLASNFTGCLDELKAAEALMQ
jgi:hypothetical protein